MSSAFDPYQLINKNFTQKRKKEKKEKFYQKKKEKENIIQFHFFKLENFLP